MPDRVSEEQTRYTLIDPQLKSAQWNLIDRTQVRFEIPVQNYDTKLINGFTDYCLYRENGEVIAVVEAKRTSRDPRVGLKQVENYIKEIETNQTFRPYAFLANGEDIFFWDSERYAERHVAGFFSRENLERFLYLKQNKIPLNQILINESIIDRPYQVEAVRRIAESIEQKNKRKALLVMATGTGKTRTIMALIDVFIRARQAQKILFLADRDTLVGQASSKGFKKYLPNESRTRIRTYDINKNVRLFVSTIQTLDICYSKFTPADFDLIISDECHRSIYNKFTDVLAYFDAIQIGLTATPAHFIDRDTFNFFDCDGVTPTFLYEYDTAVKENYLADYNVYSAQTKFQRKGIKFDDLTEDEKITLVEKGFDPEDINFEGTDLEKKVSNSDTIRKQWEEFMDVCYKDSTGQLPAKSIVFAVTHNHALRLKEHFDKMYPEHGGKLVQVIDSKMERNKEMLEDFTKESNPRIAVSVDMLDTGFDFPEVMNLAFWKPVGSQIKFWQMLGRGTRHHDTCEKLDWLPNKYKDDFLIVDFWENFEHFGMMPKDEDIKNQIPILVTIFNTRLNKLKHFISDQKCEDAKRIITELRNSIASIPQTSYTVRRNLHEVREVWEDDYWSYINSDKLRFLRMKVAPLLRFVPGINPNVTSFTSKMDKFGLYEIEKKDYKILLENIKEDVALLPTTIDDVKKELVLINDILTGSFENDLSLTKIDNAKVRLAPLMKYKRDKPSILIELDLADIIEARNWVVLRKDSKKVYVEEYRKKIEERILKLAEEHPVLKKLKAGIDVDIEDLVKLEETLITEFNSDEISLDEENMLKAFGVKPGSFIDFVKHVLNIEKMPSYFDIVKKSFDAFILNHNYNADQSRFLRAVQSVFIERRKIEEADLYDAPFTQFGMNAVERYFTEEEIKDIIELTKKFNIK
ncbi:MAG: DEAD/DEAH box helicase family protein [Ignavibacteria bacterium]|nr:DEAD/DEAH box helicase family protein [Ignavibacteria bacterium]